MVRASTPARGRWVCAGAVALLVSTGLGASCSRDLRDEPASAATLRTADLPAPQARLVVATDLHGYLEPCGCSTDMLGGIDRLAAKLRSMADDGTPTLFVTAGDLLFDGLDHGVTPEQARAQETWRAETLVAILNRLDLAASAPGPLDFSYGASTLRRLAADASFPLLAAGSSLDLEEDPLGATVMRRVGPYQVGLVGVADLRTTDGRAPDGVRPAADLVETTRQAVARLRSEGADVVVALARTDRRTGRRVARTVDGLDFLVQGGLDDAEAPPPSTAGGTVIVQAGHQGHGFVHLDLWRRGEGPWTDVGLWRREVERERLRTRERELRANLARWQREGEHDPADLQAQRARLARLEAEAEALAAAPAADRGNVFTAAYVPLPLTAPRDPEIDALVNAYDRRVNEHNRVALAGLRPEPAGEGAPSYVGSAACAACHGPAHAQWTGTPHAHAYATLETQHKNFNLACVGCHVTGYLEPGGSTVTHVDGLVNVGCESCHGPGSAHVAAPTEAAVTLDPGERLCRSCHNPEHSTAFRYDVYRPRVLGPGHGFPPTASAGGRQAP